MALQTIDISRTGMLFFDILNGFYHATPKETKERLRPMVDNAFLKIQLALKKLATLKVFAVVL